METIPVVKPAPVVCPFGPALSDVLLQPTRRGFSTLAVVPSNVRAVETGLLFATGTLLFAAVLGPSGWGKSHLLEAVANHHPGPFNGRRCELWSALEWLNGSRTRSGPAALLLDNVQDALARSRSRQALRVALERRVRAGWPTLLAFTETGPTRSVRAALPQQREWALATLRTPDAVEREVVVGQMAETEGVLLAPELRRILAHRLEGNGRTLLGALKRLQLAGDKWITPADVLRACGVLNPFFASSSAWDLRDHLLEVAADYACQCAVTTRQDLAAYAMLKVAQLSEADVARYLKLEPGHAYAVAQRVEADLHGDGAARAVADRFVNRVVATLQPR